jgi:hypothetical protein
MIAKIEVCKYRDGTLYLEKEIGSQSGSDASMDALGLQGALIRAFNMVPQAKTAGLLEPGEDRSGFDDEPEYQEGEGHPQMDKALAEGSYVTPVFKVVGLAKARLVRMALKAMQFEARCTQSYLLRREILEVETMIQDLTSWQKANR